MRITPLDIRKQPFRKQLMGFDRDEVNSFLEMVANEFEQVIRQKDDFSTKIKVLQERLDGFEKIEKTLNETLITAQRISDEARLNAQKEAELILRDAQVRADKYVDQSRNSVHQLESDIMSLKTQRDSFLVRFKSMLKDQLALLQVISDTLDDTRLEKNISDGELLRNEVIDATKVFDDETMDELPLGPIV